MRVQRLILMVLAGVLVLLALGAVSAFAGPLETPVTKPATVITGSSAVLHGELNPGKAGGAGAVYEFLYSLSSEKCHVPGETHHLPEPPAVSLGDQKEAVEIEATNLMPGSTYAFCVLEEHEGEEVPSPALTFTTLATAKPYVYGGTTIATEVGAFSATFNAAVNPDEQNTTYSFEYATNEAFTGAKTIPGTTSLQPPAFFYQEVPASISTGSVLAAETTYYFRVLATNSTGTTTGPVEHLTTQPPAKPVVLNENVTALNSFEPKLEANINPNYEETSYSFQYSTKATGEALEGTIHTLPGAPPAKPLPAILDEEPGILAGPVGVPGLQGGVIYYYRVVANDKTSEEAQKPVYGPVQEFTADGVPVVTTNPTEESTRTSAPVSGSITPQGLASTYRFAYIPQAEYEPGAANPYAHGKNTHETKLTEENGESILGYTAQPVALTLEELQPGTTYDYTLIASNELGTTVAPNQTFTTAVGAPPVVTTGGAEGVSQLSAVITGTVDTQGLQTTERFEFGTMPYAGALKPVTVVASAGTVDSIAHAFTNDLQPGTTYYYRAIASSQDGEVDGAEQSFTTPGFPAALAPANVLPFVPYTSLAVLQAREAKEGKASTPKALTRAAKLGKALKVCHRRKGARRARCEAAAHRRYGAAGGGGRHQRASARAPRSR